MTLIALEDIVPVKPRVGEAAPSVRPVIRKEPSLGEDRPTPNAAGDAGRPASAFEGGFAAVKDDLERRTR